MKIVNRVCLINLVLKKSFKNTFENFIEFSELFAAEKLRSYRYFSNAQPGIANLQLFYVNVVIKSPVFKTAFNACFIY